MVKEIPNSKLNSSSVVKAINSNLVAVTRYGTGLTK